MAATSQGSQGRIRLFQIAGINVFLHWSWFLVAVYEIGQRKNNYSSVVWNGIEYLALFAIVTMHEFGHSLACRQVGGRANQIVLWPLGGVAIVDPPPRPGAMLWSIAAGPLVNVVLLPILWGAVRLSSYSGLAVAVPDAHTLLRSVLTIDVVLLVFNLLPVYPLDGGQILRSLLWYIIGRAQSLMVASGIGFIGVAGLGVLALAVKSAWLAIIGAFAALQCVAGFRYARSLKQLGEAPRRGGFACPSCKAAPEIGPFWGCGSCRKSFDPFDRTQAVTGSGSSQMLNLSFRDPLPQTEIVSEQSACPNCGAHFAVAKCLDCGAVHPFMDWQTPAEILSATSSEFHPATVPKSMPPSAVPIVLGIVLLLVAMVALAVGLLFFKVSSDQIARQPRYQSAIERLWSVDGIALPGERTFFMLRGERYGVYLETTSGEASRNHVFDIDVTNADSGQPVALTPEVTLLSLEHNGRKLIPKVSFAAPISGSYKVHVSARQEEPVDASVKVGPAIDLVNGTLSSVSNVIGIAACVFALICLMMMILLFRHHRRRRKQFVAALQAVQ